MKLLTLLLIISLTGCSPALNPSRIGKLKKSTEDLELVDRLKSLEKNYGIKLYHATKRKVIVLPIFGERLVLRLPKDTADKGYYSYRAIVETDWQQRDSLLEIFIEEWQKYPVEFVRNSGLKSIVFVDGLAVGGQKRYAMPEDKQSSLFYDISYMKPSAEVYVRHNIHHEYYHLIALNLYDSFYYKDPSWLCLNEEGFTYGLGGETAYKNPGFSREKHPLKGFVTGYATYGVEEDMAEVLPI